MLYVPMSCQSEGALQVFIEPVVPVLDLLVVGRSPMVHLLAELANALGWSARVADVPALSADDIHERSLVVVATQGHGDEEALELCARARPAFLGLVASHKRGVSLLEYLAERGVPQELLDRVHTPVGLDLGHTSHREIAVAVLAELVQMRAAGAFTTPAEQAAAARQRDGGDHRGDRPRLRDDGDRRRVRLVREHARARRDDVPLLLRRLPGPVRRRPRALPLRSGGLNDMLVSNEFEVSQPVDKVWEFFQDVPGVAACLPGAELTDDLGDDEYAGTVNLRMGPVKLEFAGKAHVAERDEAAKRLVLDASGLRPEGPRQRRDAGDRPAQRGLGWWHQGRRRPGPADLRRGGAVRPRA